jgi:HEAT repeat protein
MSEDWSERASAAASLAKTIDDETAPVLLRLLLDADDTAVVQAAAKALLARSDDSGVRLFCTAYAQADDELGDHLNDSLLAVSQQPENLRLMREAAQTGMQGAGKALRWLRLDM